jgi:transposase
VDLCFHYSKSDLQLKRIKEVYSVALFDRRPPDRSPKRQAQKRCCKTETAELVAAYRTGAKQSELAERFGIRRGTVRDILVREGVAIRPRNLSTEVLAEAVLLYESGWSVAKIGDKLGRDGTTVWRGLQAMGVSLRRPWER